MMHDLLMLVTFTGAPIVVDIEFVWRVIEALLLLAITAMVKIGTKAAVEMRDDMRDLKAEVRGKDGKGGLLKFADDIGARVGNVERHQWLADEVEKATRGEYEGEERRNQLERRIDQLVGEVLAKRLG